MKFSRVFILAASTVCLFSASQAGGAMIVGGQAADAPRQSLAALPPATPATMDLIGGVVSAVDLPKRTMTVSGNALAWHPTQLRVFMPNGVRASEQDLRAGMRVRFALEPATSGVRRAILIYVDER